jgi:hypothetical protein
MTGWQTTAKTIYCDAVDDEVTILVMKDSSFRCTGRKKYTNLNYATHNIIKEKGRKSKKLIKCQGDDCPRVIEYRDKIIAEEAK